MLKIGLTGLLLILALAAIHAAPPAQIEAGSMAQKIFYFHVGSAWAAFLSFLTAGAYGIGHLIGESIPGRESRRRADLAARCYSAMEVGFIFCSIVLVTGPIWARPVWGVWWRWEPRLTTFLILWATYASGLIMHRSISRATARDRLVSVYAILASIEIPIVYASVLFWRPESQFHPVRIHLDGAFRRPLWMSLVAMTGLCVVLMGMRSRIQVLEDRR